jgi:hypothetical protein
MEPSTALPMTIQRDMNDASPEQWQLLATIALLSLSRAQAAVALEKKLNHTVLALLQITTLHHQQEPISDPLLNNLEQNYTTLCRLISDVNNIVRAHNHAMQSLQSVDNECLRRVITAMINDTSTYIKQTCVANANSIDTTLKKVSSAFSGLNKNIDQLDKITATLLEPASFADQKNPQELSQVELSEAILVAIYQQAETLYKNGLLLNSMIHSTQEAGIFMFYAYYKAIYSLMKERALDDLYFTLMFDANGFLDKAKRINALPIPNS